MATVQPNPVCDAYTIFPAPDTKEFWAASRAGARALANLKCKVFSAGVVIRTKYKAKSAYQYFKVTETGYVEVSKSVFEIFLTNATPPVTKSKAKPAAKAEVKDTKTDDKIVASDSPEAAKIVDTSDMPKLAKSVLGVDEGEAENVKDVALRPVTAADQPDLTLQTESKKLVVEFKCQACGHLHQITSYTANAPVTLQVEKSETAPAPAEVPAASEAPVEAAPAAPSETAPVPTPVTEKAAKPSKAKVAKEPKTESAPAAESKSLTGLYANESALVYVASKGADMSMADIEAMETLIRGNAAPSRDLLDRLRSSKLLVLAKDDGNVVGCMGLQAKSADYITTTNTKAGTTLPTDALEICWINVSADRKGAARDGVIVNMFDTLKSSKANNPELAGKALYAVYNVGNVAGYEAMALLGLRKHDREHKGLVKQAQVFLG